ncbi:hypothetical protein PIROE2DRAFT_15129 [Piromyces sp. E2]|nr:hypothetical protein PIROE2DRAFT_15129 [Piromyces sp. E2]|eukprot:OUM59355.1 hypothetical protein PIROE2DRAFT_15129 [Piromyces sp. E2]
MGIIIGNNNIKKYIYNKLFSNVKCQQTTRHREISTISLSTSGKIIALGHVNGYASATSLGGEAEPGTLIVYKYQLNNINEEFNPLFCT